MADTRPERRFTRIDRLPPYVFNITAELKMAARRRGEDIIDFSMGNPDGATPPHIVEKLCTVAQRPDTHGYSTSRGIPRLRRAISRWYEERYNVDIDPESEAIVTIGSKEGLAHLMLATLVSKGAFDSYMDLLKNSYQAQNLPGVMCRSTVSVDWQGWLSDCDFNQQLGLPLGNSGVQRHLRDLLTTSLDGKAIRVAGHCYGCTAGQGSSCGGALEH